MFAINAEGQGQDCADVNPQSEGAGATAGREGASSAEDMEAFTGMDTDDVYDDMFDEGSALHDVTLMRSLSQEEKHILLQEVFPEMPADQLQR
jgi:hypothetical protein